MEDALKNYYSLVAKVDELCSRIESDFAQQLTCHAGCSGCCQHISLAWVEAVALATALKRAPANTAEAIRLQAQTARPDGPCPLLLNNHCALYADRPIICRTHGLPILTGCHELKTIDFCPKNFQGTATLPGSAVVDLDRLNTLLDSVNRLFIAELLLTKPYKERLSIAEALLLDIDVSGDTP